VNPPSAASISAGGQSSGENEIRYTMLFAMPSTQGE
jgi:hypothetical protein